MSAAENTKFPVPPSVARLLREAADHFGTGRWPAAVDCCRRILAQSPNHPEALGLAGAALLQQGALREAVDWIGRAIRAAPDMAQAHNNLGAAWHRMGKAAEAERSFRRAVELDGGNADFHKNLGMILQQLGRSDEALAASQKALEISPEHPGAHNTLGLIYTDRGAFERAAEHYRRALRAKPDYAEARHNFGWLLEQRGDFDDARRAYRQSLAARPGFYRAWYALSRVHAVDRDDPAFAQLERLKNTRPLAPHAGADLSFALGKMYEDIGEYTAAFNHFRRGNEYRRLMPGQAFDPAAYTRAVDGLIADTPAAAFDRTDTIGDPTERPVFVVGMPRSGTTLLEQVLAAHPRVAGAGESGGIGAISNRCLRNAGGARAAIRQMDADAARSWAAAYREGLEQYRGGAERIVDKMPDNFQALWCIAAVFPRAKLIHMRRDARDTCLSCYKTHFFKGHPYANDQVSLGRYYRDYARLMEHWHRVLPRAIHRVRYEDLVTDFEKTVADVLAFAGLAWHDDCLDFHRAKRRISTASSYQVRQPLYTGSVGKWRAYEPHLGPLLAELEGVDGE